MDAKITKKRLNEMLSYDWVKILLSIAGAILVWSLIFTMTATKITPSQQFTVLNYRGNVQLATTRFNDLYKKAYADGVYSYEVIETNVRDVTEMVEGTESQLLQATLGTDEGDLIFLPATPDPRTAQTENDVTTYEMTYLESFLYSEYRYIADLSLTNENGYFKTMEAFLNGFYTEGFEKAESLDEAAVHRYFRARVKANKDKRFKTEAQISAGEKLEVERVKKYREALVKTYAYLADGVIALTPVDMEYDGVTHTKYMLNLCPDETKMGKLINYVAYETTFVDGEGKESTKKAVQDMHVALFKVPGIEASFEFESLSFVVYLIDTCLAA